MLSLRHVPVVVVSGTENRADIQEVYGLNANCFVRKPDNLAEFLRCIEGCYRFWGSVATLGSPLAAAKAAAE